MSFKQVMEVFGGALMLWIGLRAIVTRQVAVGDEEPYQVFYGWRAVGTGVVSLFVAALAFASAAGLISLPEG